MSPFCFFAVNPCWSSYYCRSCSSPRAGQSAVDSWRGVDVNRGGLGRLSVAAGTVAAAPPPPPQGLVEKVRRREPSRDRGRLASRRRSRPRRHPVARPPAPPGRGDAAVARGAQEDFTTDTVGPLDDGEQIGKGASGVQRDSEGDESGRILDDVKEAMRATEFFAANPGTSFSSSVPPSEGLGMGHGQDALRRVLHAYSAYDREVGYCQGMNFIAAMFLTFLTEEEAFWLLVVVMNEEPYELRELFRPDMAGTREVLYISEKLLAQFLPRLARCFEEEGVDVSMFVTQWLMMVYASTFPFELVLRVWDSLSNRLFLYGSCAAV